MNGVASFRAASVALAVLLLAACSSSPIITNVAVNPSTIKLSGIVNTATFVVSCNVGQFGGDVKSVEATVEGQSISVPLTATGNADGWSGSVQLTLFTGFSAGVYQIDITATGNDGSTNVDKAAATVTVAQ